MSLESASSISIDRNKPIDVNQSFGEDWFIFQEDACSLALSEIDLSSVKFLTLNEGHKEEVWETDSYERLKTMSYIRLDANVFETLWANQHLIPNTWKEISSPGRAVYLLFHGTVIYDWDDLYWVLSLRWNGTAWERSIHSLNGRDSIDYKSVVLFLM